MTRGSPPRSSAVLSHIPSPADRPVGSRGREDHRRDVASRDVTARDVSPDDGPTPAASSVSHARRRIVQSSRLPGAPRRPRASPRCRRATLVTHPWSTTSPQGPRGRDPTEGRGQLAVDRQRRAPWLQRHPEPCLLLATAGGRRSAWRGPSARFAGSPSPLRGSGTSAREPLRARPRPAGASPGPRRCRPHQAAAAW